MVTYPDKIYKKNIRVKRCGARELHQRADRSLASAARIFCDCAKRSHHG
jgi:hypothetical protein